MNRFKKVPYSSIKYRAFGQRIEDVEWITNGHFLLTDARVTMPYIIKRVGWKISGGILQLDPKPPSLSSILKEPKKSVLLSASPLLHVNTWNKDYRRALFGPDSITWVNEVYFAAISDCELKKGSGKWDAVRAYSGDKLVGIIMPIRNEFDDVEQTQFKKLVEFLDQEEAAQ